MGTLFRRTIGGVDITVESHEKMHLDEIAALWLAEKFGDEAWVRAYCPDGVLRLGVGGGAFDEHQRKGDLPTEDCCATLMASSLALGDDPALQQLLKFLYNVDVRGNGNPFDIYNAVKLLNEKLPGETERVIAWAYLALDAKYDEQLDFTEALSAVEKALHVLVGDSVDGGIQRMVIVVESNSKTLVKAAVHTHKHQMAALIKRSPSTGHVQIFTNRGVMLPETARLIRIAERRRAKMRDEVTEGELRGDGFRAGVENWYLNERGQQLLNGSLTATGVPSTKLGIEEITDCVVLGIGRWMRGEVKHTAAADVVA